MLPPLAETLPPELMPDATTSEAEPVLDTTAVGRQRGRFQDSSGHPYTISTSRNTHLTHSIEGLLLKCSIKEQWPPMLVLLPHPSFWANSPHETQGVLMAGSLFPLPRDEHEILEAKENLISSKENLISSTRIPFSSCGLWDKMHSQCPQK